VTPPDRDAQRIAQRGREVSSIIARMEGERATCETHLLTATDEASRAAIETEILHLSLALSELRRGHYAGS
jgi:hypothetical protein